MSAPRVVAVAGSKGGTGKSLLAANIGIFLATLGKRVILVDGALGTPDLHVFVAVSHPVRTLAEYLAGERAHLVDVAMPTPVPGLRLIAGAGDPTWVASPRPSLVRRLAAELRRLPADYVIVDLGAGTDDAVLELFLAADTGIVITLPEPTAVEQAYRFLRCAVHARLRRAGLGALLRTPAGAPLGDGGIIAPLDLYQRALRDADPRAAALERAILDFQPHLVVNWARSKADMEMGRAISSAARRRLGIPVSYLGHLEYDEAVWVAVRRRRPLLVEHPESRVSKCIEKVTRGLLADRVEVGHQVVAGESHYDLIEVAPTASFEDIRRANRRIRDIYGPESVVMSGLYDPAALEAVHRRFDVAYTTLMDASKRKEYDLALFPDGVPLPVPAIEPAPAVAAPSLLAAASSALPQPPSERPPMPLLSPRTDYTGALLQQIREAHGIELREISERSKIGMAYLQAIESEAFRRLPAIVYVRGFLAEYAKILGLDSVRVLESYLERYKLARAGSQDGISKAEREREE